LFIISGSFAEFEKAVHKAYEVFPGNPDSLLFLKIASLYSGRFEEVRNIISKYEDAAVFSSIHE
jgi:hypothetical protein